MRKTETIETPTSLRLGQLFRGNIGVIIGSNMVNGFGTGIISPFLSLYFVSIGGDPIRLGLMSSLSTLIQCLILFIGGRLADHYGRRRLIVIAAFYAILFPALYALIHDWRIFFLTSALGAFGAVSSPALHATVADSVPPSKRTTAISVLQVFPAFPTVFSPLIGGWFIAAYGLQIGFRLACVFVAGTTLVSALIMLLFLKETIRPENVQESATHSNSPLSVRRALSSQSLHSLVALLSAYGLIAFANALVSNYYILYANSVIHIDAFNYGIIISLQILFITLLKIPGGWASDKYGKKKIMIISILTCIPFVIAFTFSRLFVQAAVTMVLLAIAGMYYAPAHEALQADLAPREIRGRVTSFWDIAGAVGGAIGAPLGGFFFQAIGPATPFYLFAVVEAAAAILIIVCVREPQRAEN
ncbi:MAG: MFS transporter [Candidatus Bathyarchaeia archaeon]|jgi:MFS family permease